MKCHLPIYLMGALVAVCSALMLEAQSNAPGPLILPPNKWDNQKHLLASLMTTNRPGSYSLQPAWVGIEKVTARTGYYTNWFETVNQSNRWFHFERFTVRPGRIMPMAPEDRYVCEVDTNGNDASFSTYAYRAALPTDSDLLGVRDPASLTNLIGWTFPKGKKTDPRSWVGIGGAYFTLGPYNSIETVRVEYMQHATGTKIDGIIVRRGHFHQ
ncbi:MAG TPA: hypothetical protein VK815_03570 [Candidatus Acidoferrales bacterium]|jgi:hypothetical protein|nr:hypothetical protein [Candidatus Acidoferrales bacterium]